MQNNNYLPRHPRHAHSALLPPSTSLPQSSKSQPPLKGTFDTGVYQGARLVYPTGFTTSPTSSLVTQDDTTTDQRSATAKPEPAQYTLDDDPHDAPGTAAYYKSWAFRKKVNEGTTHVPGHKGEAGEDIDDSADEGYNKKPKQVARTESLVMVFSRTSVRCANTQRKMDRRMQKANRRMYVSASRCCKAGINNWQKVLEEDGRREVFL